MISCNMFIFSFLLVHCLQEIVMLSVVSPNFGFIFVMMVLYIWFTYNWISFLGYVWCGSPIVNTTALELVVVARDTLLEVRCRSYLKGICFMGMACLTYFVSYHIKLAISSFSLYENCHIKLLSLWGMACLTYLFSYHYVFGNN